METGLKHTPIDGINDQTKEVSNDLPQIFKRSHMEVQESV
jgi:hypothetical protein